jgi:hypothetical protein
MENKIHTRSVKESLLESAHGFETKLIPFFAKFPHIPESGRKVLVDIVPWLALIFGIIGLLVLLGAGALTTILAIPALFTGNVWVITTFITVLLGILSAVLQLLAVNPLKAKMKKGWNYIFYGLLIGVVSSVVSVVSATLTTSVLYAGTSVVSSLISGALGFLIGGWLLFEIRDHFKA